MSIRTPAALLLALAAALAVASPSWPRSTVVSATGTIAAVAGSTTSYTLTLTNGGDQMMVGATAQPIQCMRFQAASGVQVASVDQPAGAQTTLVAGQGFDATLTPPLAPLGSLTWTFTTSAPYPANDAGTLTVSADCSTDVAGVLVFPQAAGPTTTAASSTTTGATQPCHCARLSLALNPANVYSSPAALAPEHDARARLAALVNWSMSCSAGAGNCSGTIAVVAPAGSTAEVFTASRSVPTSGLAKGAALYRRGRPMALRFTCAGPCATTRGTFFLQLDTAAGALPAGLAGKTIRLRFALTCTTGSTRSLALVFAARGRLDPARSTLR